MKSLRLFIRALGLFALVMGFAEMVLRFCDWSPQVPIYTEIPDPAIRYVHTPGLRVRFWDSDVALNSGGLRDREFSLEKAPGTFRIFLVGECTAFGRGVALEESYGKVLERILNDRKPSVKYEHYEVLNGGFVQYTDFQKAAFLKNYGMKYRPDLILFGHDVGAKPWIETRSRLRWFSLLRDRTPRRFLSARFAIFMLQKYVISKWAQFVTLKDTEPLIAQRYGNTELYRHMRVEEAFAELGSLKVESGTPVLVVLHPWLNDLAENRYKFHDVHHRYAKLSKYHRLDFLDFYDSTYKNQERERFLLRGDPRPNPLAYELIAEATYRKLVTMLPGWRDHKPSRVQRQQPAQFTPR